MSNEPATVLITGQADKLPIGMRMLLEPDAPIPPGVQFFEERQSGASITRTAVLGMAFLMAGLLLCFLGVVLIFLPIVGIVFILAGALILNSIRSKMGTMSRQHAGKVVRTGLFILPQHLMIRTGMDFTVIPHERVGALTADKLVYFWGKHTKTLKLPSDLVDCDAKTMQQAVQAWLKPTA